MSVHDLQAPKEDGAILAYPPLEKVGRLLEENRRLLSALRLDILGQTYQSIRLLARRHVLDAARQYLTAAGEPVPASSGDAIFLAGHQPDMFHPGVWAKNFALNGLARKHGGAALNLVVDNDAARSPLLHVPAGAHVASVPYDHWQGESPYEERNVLDEALFASLPARAQPYFAEWSFEPLLSSFWAEVLRQGKCTPLLGARIAAARRSFERRWGCAQAEVPISRLCQGEAFAWFACHLLVNAGPLRQVYNDVVHDYRLRHGLKNPYHPVPDLAEEDDWCELPFWAWRTGQKRRARLFVRHTATEQQLRAGDESWPSLPRDASCI